MRCAGAVAVLLTSAVVQAQDVNLLLRVDAAAGLRSTVADRLELTLQPSFDLRRESFSLHGVLRFRQTTQSGLDVRREAREQRASWSRPWALSPHADLELRELYIDRRIGEAQLRLGKQQIVWGQADGLRVLDVVNPLSYREFILPLPEDRRIPLWSANLELPLKVGSLQLLWLPDPTYDELPLHGQAFALRSPLLVPQAPAGVPVQVDAARRPRGLAAGSDVGARWQGTLGRWDLTANVLHHRVDDPVPRRSLTASGVRVTPTYERSDLIGGSFSTVVGSATLRGEVGYSTRKWFLTRDLRDTDGVFPSDELAAVIGLDYTGLRDSLLSVQLFASRIGTHPAAATRHRAETQLTLLAQRQAFNQALTLRALAAASVERRDGLLQAQLTWQAGSHWQLGVGVETFWGRRDGLFGQFHDAARATLSLQWAR